MFRRRTLPLLLLILLGGALLPAAAAQEGSTVADYILDGRLFLLNGDCELAQYYFREALKLEPENAEALVGNGRALACRNNYPLAIDAFQEAIEVDPENVDAYVHLALTYQDQHLADAEQFPNRLNEALRTLEMAEGYAPEDGRVLNAKGVVLFQMGSLQAARTELEKAAEASVRRNSGLSPAEQSVVHVNLGRAYRDLGNLEQALTAFRRAVVLNPASSTAHSNVGNIHYRLGNCHEAEYELAQAAALDPESLSAVSQLAIALFECGNVAASVPHFERALDLNGAVFNPPLYTYLARAYLELDRFDEAVFRAQQGAVLPPLSPEAYYYLGRTYEARSANGDRDAARDAFRRALELDPGFEAAQQALESF